MAVLWATHLVDEAEKSGQIIKDLNISIDISYTSYLKRAIKTLTTILKKNNLELKLSEKEINLYCYTFFI